MNLCDLPDAKTDHTFCRLCPVCRIQWQATFGTRDCPRCGAQAFFTMNAGDIGTAMQLEGAGLTLADFEKVEW